MENGHQYVVMVFGTPIGVQLFFAKNLGNGYSNGIRKDHQDEPLESDGINIGECNSADSWLDCSNKQIPHSDCAKGKLASVAVQCS